MRDGLRQSRSGRQCPGILVLPVNCHLGFSGMPICQDVHHVPPTPPHNTTIPWRPQIAGHILGIHRLIDLIGSIVCTDAHNDEWEFPSITLQAQKTPIFIISLKARPTLFPLNNRIGGGRGEMRASTFLCDSPGCFDQAQSFLRSVHFIHYVYEEAFERHLRSLVGTFQFTRRDEMDMRA